MFWAIDHLIETKTESTDGEQLVSPSRDDGGDEVHSGIYFVFTVKILRETEFSKQYKCDPIFINDFNLNHKIQETIKSTSVKSPNSNRSFNPELMKCISETKSKFAETLISLDLAERCLQCPSEKTAEQLKLLFDRGKCTCKDTCKTLKKFYTLLIRFTEGENENAEYKDYENNKNDKGGKDDSDYHLDCECQPRSISAESLRKGTAKQEKLCTVSKILPYQDEEPVTKIKKGTAGKMWREKNSEQEHASLKWRGLNQKSHSETRIELLEQEISCLEELLQDVLADLGELTVEKTARESEGRKFELFHRIFRSSSPEAKRSVVSGINDKPDTEDGRLGYLNSSRTNGNGSPTGFPKAQRTNESVNSPVNGSTGEQRVQGAESLVPGSNHQEEKEANETCSNTGISVFGTNSENQNPTMQNSSKSVEKTSGGEGIDTPGNINGTSDAASTSRDESGEQSLTQRSNEDLLFSIQQDDSNGRECISLGNIPPTSVATTLYNNYKLLLLSLGQSLLSSDVVKLKDWASQGFAIANVQSATDVLLQLDQKGIINASNLSPLRDFFESVVRIDLVYIIDAFLLGDYSLLRQTPTWKKREASRAQNPQHGSTSRFSSLLNTLSSSTSTGRNVAASGSLQMSASRNPATSRKPENSNGPQNSVAQQNHQHALSGFLGYPNTNNANLVSRSPNENQSRAHEQRNEKPIASGFTETSVVVADGPVTSKFL
ncbi:---NA--- [Paramuricea clavata]|uniref:---NA n=1 Tax=Paramuricea clavata TaxID=317549 RepID=A0A6S7JYC7_PARCT|nr:---NA--- [Paramuricea clavata]